MLFLFVAVLSLAMTGKTLAAWEQRLECGVQSFSGTVIDAGVGIPGYPERGRWQIIRLANGVPAMLRMREAGRLGDRVKGIASFRRGEGMRNPGGFSSRLRLWSSGVAHSGQPVSYEIERIDHIALTIRRMPDALRDRVRFHLAPFWKSTSGGPLLASLTLGDTSLLSDVEQYQLRVSGLSHLTSVSGTHLYFFLSPFQMLTRRISRTRRGRQRVLLALTLMPGVLCGWKSGIARASLSVFMLRLDGIFGWRRDAVNMLLIVATCLLILNPFAIHAQSFWMSLAASGAIRFVASSAGERAQDITRVAISTDDRNDAHRLGAAVISSLRRLTRMAGRVFLVSLMAQAAVLPYVLMTSAGFQLLSPLINAVAIPLASFLTASSYVMVLMLSVIPLTGYPLAKVASLSASLLEPGTRLFHGLARKAASVRGAFIPLEWIAFMILFFILGYLLLNRGANIYRIKQRVGIILVTLGLVVSAVWTVWRRKEWRVIFLDVGQGDATLLISPEGYTCLIDGGDRGQGFHTILPVVRLHSLRRIDLAIVTHAHVDHAFGILELLECGMIDRLCLPVTSHRPSQSSVADVWESDLTERLHVAAHNAGVSRFSLKSGDRLNLGSLSVDVHYPEEDRGNSDLNDDSLVLRIDIDGFTLLFSGDLTAEGERQLLRGTADLSADLLHVPHHGSKSSSSVPFLQSISPSISVISVGRENRFSHPHADVLQRLEDVGSEVFRTDRSGAIILNIRGGKGTITEWIAPCAGGVK